MKTRPLPAPPRPPRVFSRKNSKQNQSVKTSDCRMTCLSASLLEKSSELNVTNMSTQTDSLSESFIIEELEESEGVRSVTPTKFRNSKSKLSPETSLQERTESFSFDTQKLYSKEAELPLKCLLKSKRSSSRPTTPVLVSVSCQENQQVQATLVMHPIDLEKNPEYLSNVSSQEDLTDKLYFNKTNNLFHEPSSINIENFSTNNQRLDFLDRIFLESDYELKLSKPASSKDVLKKTRILKKFDQTESTGNFQGDEHKGFHTILNVQKREISSLTVAQLLLDDIIIEITKYCSGESKTNIKAIDEVSQITNSLENFTTLKWQNNCKNQVKVYTEKIFRKSKNSIALIDENILYVLSSLKKNKYRKKLHLVAFFSIILIAMLFMFGVNQPNPKVHYHWEFLYLPDNLVSSSKQK